MASNYLVIAPEKLTTQGLRKLLTAFKRQGHEVIDLHAGRTVTKDRERIKPFTMYFDNGQSVKVSLNLTGDIVQVMMNSTVIPVTSPKSEADFAKDVSRKLELNQKKFDAKLARKAQAAVKDESTRRTAIKTAVQRLSEAQAAEQAATESLELMKAERTEKQGAVLEANNVAANHRQALEAEKQLTNQLLEQLEELGVKPNV